MIQFVDHLFMILLFVVQPVHGFLSFKRYVARVEAGDPADRASLYRQTLVLEWTAFAVLAASWFALGRPVAELGYVAVSGSAFWIGAALIVIVSAVLVYNWHKSKSVTPEEKVRHIRAFGKLVHFLPHDNRDYRLFVGLSLTAGIVEETIYRGFAIWYLGQFMPVWAAILASSVAFGIGHSYQGPGGMVRVTLIGLVFGAFYVFTGSIWLPILAHFLLDALQGASIVEVLRDDDQSAAVSGDTLATKTQPAAGDA